MSVELPNKRVQWVGSHHKSTTSNMGTNKHRGETNKERKAAAQQATRDNRMVMVLEASGKRRWYRASAWYAMQDARAID